MVLTVLFKPTEILQLNYCTITRNSQNTISILFSFFLAHCELSVNNDILSVPVFTLTFSFSAHTTLAAECKYTVDVAIIWINPLLLAVLKHNLINPQ